MKRTLLIAAPALALTTFAALAQSTTQTPADTSTAAADPASTSPFTANIAVTTKYKFRGQDQGNSDWFSPAVQGGFDWSRNGFYVGNWNSNVSFGNAAVEMDFYGGYKGQIGKALGYDVGVLTYYYPQKDRVVSFDTTELYGAVSYQWLSLKYSHTVSNDYFGIGQGQSRAGATGSRPKGRRTGYLDLTGNYPLADKVTVNAHIGYTRYASDLRNARTPTADLGVPNFYDYKLGVTYDLGSNFFVAAALVGANKRSFYGDINKPRTVFTLSKTL